MDAPKLTSEQQFAIHTLLCGAAGQLSVATYVARDVDPAFTRRAHQLLEELWAIGRSYAPTDRQMAELRTGRA